MAQLIREEVQKNNDNLYEIPAGQFCTTVKTGILRKKLQYAEPYNFKRKANEDQFKFNTKVIDNMAEVSGFLQQTEISKAQEEIKKGEQLLRERQRHILLAHKSEYG